MNKTSKHDRRWEKRQKKQEIASSLNKGYDRKAEKLGLWRFGESLHEKNVKHLNVK